MTKMDYAKNSIVLISDLKQQFEQGMAILKCNNKKSI